MFTFFSSKAGSSLFLYEFGSCVVLIAWFPFLDNKKALNCVVWSLPVVGGCLAKACSMEMEGWRVMGGGSSNKSPGGVRYCSQYQGVCSGGAQVWSPKGALSPPSCLSVAFAWDVRYRHLQCQGNSTYSQPKASARLLKGRSHDITWIQEMHRLESSDSALLSLAILNGWKYRRTAKLNHLTQGEVQ